MERDSLATPLGISRVRAFDLVNPFFLLTFLYITFGGFRLYFFLFRVFFILTRAIVSISVYVMRNVFNFFIHLYLYIELASLGGVATLEPSPTFIGI